MDIKSVKPHKGGKGKFKQGYFEPKNPSKYKGDPTKIIYRSSWEHKFCIWCDTNSNVLEWGSEPFSISYKWDIDGKAHQYFPDFYVKMKKGDDIVYYVVEVKPKRQLKKPKLPETKTPKAMARYKSEYETYIKNLNKNQALNRWAKDNDYEVMFVTENSGVAN